MSGLEFGLGRFGDLRLEKGGCVCTRPWLIDRGRASAGWAGPAREIQFTRFLRNRAVTAAEMAEHAAELVCSTAQRSCDPLASDCDGEQDGGRAGRVRDRQRHRLEAEVQRRRLRADVPEDRPAARDERKSERAPE